MPTAGETKWVKADDPITKGQLEDEAGTSIEQIIISWISYGGAACSIISVFC